MNDTEKPRQTLIREMEELRAENKALRQAEGKYRQWFEDAPISLWEEDFSEVKRHVDEIRDQDVGDLDAFFHAHPDIVRELAGLVLVVDVNHATLLLYRAKSKNDFLSRITTVFARESFEAFIPALMAVAEGRTRIFSEKTHLTLDGQVLHIQLYWAVAPGYEETYERVLVSIVDITPQKEVEMALERKSRERRLLLDTIPVQVWYLKDPDTYGALNVAHADFFGRHPRDLAHKRLEEITSSEAAAVCREGNIRVFESRKLVHTEEWLFNAAGEERLIAITKTPRLDEKGKVEFVVCAGVDITDQRQTEMLLRESEARFRHIFELSPVGTELYDRNGRLILANPACLEIFGVENAQEIFSFGLFDDPNLDESLKQRLRRGEMVQYDVAFDFEKVRAAGLYRTYKNGIIHLQVVITPIMQTGEEMPAGYLVLVSDVTERIISEQRIRESEKAYRLIADNMADTIWVMDMNMRFTYVSPSVTRMYGVTVDEVVGQTIDRSLTPESLQKVLVAFQEAMAEEASGTADPDRTRVVELEEYKGDGSTIWVESSMSFLRDEDQKPIGIVGASRDVTDRRRAEEAVRESKQRLILAQRLAKLGDFTWDVETGEATWSDALYDLLGYKQSERIDYARVNAKIHHPDDLDRVTKWLNDCIESDNTELVPNEYRLIRKDGKVIWVRTIGIIERIEGRHINVFATLQDITERKRAEEEKEAMEAQNRQLQKAESLGRMAGAIAHHFNNQLQAVMGNLELARGEVPKNREAALSIQEALNAAARAAKVSGQMLTYLGQTVGRRETIGLSEVCRLALPVIEAGMPGNVMLDTELPSPGPSVHADANQMEQVLTNLISNAWEAMGDNGGTIHLAVNTLAAADIPATHRFPVDWQPEDRSYACLEVRDAGLGIPEEHVEKLFDPFFSTKFTGRGLGLSVALGIVRAHGGCITVESGCGTRRSEVGGQRSEVGGRKSETLCVSASLRENPVGSVFRVFLPLMEGEVSRPEKKVALGDAIQGGGTVLLVEDTEQVRNLGVRMLQLLGFTVLAARDGVEGVEIFRERRNEIRFVLSDLTMPRMDGWKTIAALREIDPNVRVILASGYDEASVMSEVHAERPQIFLGKPYTIEGLRAAIGKVMEPQMDTDGHR